MTTKFSLVYPTRHRPQFIEMALKCLERQEYENFEIIISDNYTDDNAACYKICNESPLFEKIRYVKPPNPLGMVENWNFSLEFATGEYVCYFTDKMFVLPGTLSALDQVLKKTQPEIINWIDDKYIPNSFPDYFGAGYYRVESGKLLESYQYQEYDPQEELSKKTIASVSRNEQDPSHYARGKVCFGCFRQSLVSKIIRKTGILFHDISPDYTSMILGLSYAESAVELIRSGIVHITTDLSNGAQSAIKDKLALDFLTSLNSFPRLLSELLVPHLYSSQHNIVSHDYLSLKRRFDLDLKFNEVNWLTYIYEDLANGGREWSSQEIKNEHFSIFSEYLASRLNESERNELEAAIERRIHENKSILKINLENNRDVLPIDALNIARQLKSKSYSTKINVPCNHLLDVF